MFFFRVIVFIVVVDGEFWVVVLFYDKVGKNCGCGIC